MITFWNGNKSVARQEYEYQLFELLAADSKELEPIHNDLTDYPAAEDEGAVFDNGADALVTIAGNKKFAGKPLIEVKIPLCRGLLGWRLMVVARERIDEFRDLTLAQLKSKRVGVPATWVDAELFRANGFDVVERGSLDDMLGWIEQGEVDFMTLGVNEIHDTLADPNQQTRNLAIEPTLALYYPFPVVFYVNKNGAQLAERLGQQWQEKQQMVAEHFFAHYGEAIAKADLAHRQVMTLTNPMLPEGYEALIEADLYRLTEPL